MTWDVAEEVEARRLAKMSAKTKREKNASETNFAVLKSLIQMIWKSN